MQRRTLLLAVFSFCLFLLLIIWGIGYISKTSDVPFVQSFFTPMQYSLVRLFHSTPPTTTLEKLEQENTSLRVQLAKMNMIEADNKALRDQFQTATPAPSALRPVNVIGMPDFIPGITVPDYLLIGAGVADGVSVGEAVVVKDQLLGTIAAVDQHISKVQLMTQRDVSVAAKTAKTGALGVVKGFGNGQIELDNVVLSDTLTVGDMVVSGPDIAESGKGIPPGLIIGEITSVDKKSSSLFQKAHIEILTDVTHLSEVFLLVSQ